MSAMICLQCGRAFGVTTAAGDSHGLCSAFCATAYLAWGNGVFGATAPSLWAPEGWRETVPCFSYGRMR